MNFELVFKSNGRKHPYNPDKKYNVSVWGFKSLANGKVYDSPEEAEAAKAPVKRVTVKAKDKEE